MVSVRRNGTVDIIGCELFDFDNLYLIGELTPGFRKNFLKLLVIRHPDFCLILLDVDFSVEFDAGLGNQFHGFFLLLT